MPPHNPCARCTPPPHAAPRAPLSAPPAVVATRPPSPATPCAPAPPPHHPRRPPSPLTTRPRERTQRGLPPRGTRLPTRARGVAGSSPPPRLAAVTAPNLPPPSTDAPPDLPGIAAPYVRRVGPVRGALPPSREGPVPADGTRAQQGARRQQRQHSLQHHFQGQSRHAASPPTFSPSAPTGPPPLSHSALLRSASPPPFLRAPLRKGSPNRTRTPARGRGGRVP